MPSVAIGVDGLQLVTGCVDDLIEAFICFMNTPESMTGPYNLGNPGEFTIRELAEKVIDLTGSSSKLHFMPLPQDDPQQRKPDLTKTKEALGWEPKTSLKDGLMKTIPYFDQLLKRGIEIEAWSPI